MNTLHSRQADKSSAEFHRKSYQFFSEFMDRSRFGSIMLLLRQKDIADASARRRAGLDVVDIFSIGTDPADPQTLHIHTLHSGDHTVVLDHTYMYWAQLVTLRDFLERHYGLRIAGTQPAPEGKRPAGLCGALRSPYGEAERPVRDLATFRIKARGKHRCPEETGGAPAESVVALGELGGVACPYCLAEELNLNLE